ncbi:MAG: Zn-ribbon domain-containing OB-fold protein [Deltaproteobacteria bacterium]|uniref:Zn-ribbon domain-containing OB-fold protein n=1 Tax=Candidatus Desulfacyla euxinica TaxID=2841693 RepID=A0A8J6MVF6_9DELT|nr:Zn-ribbon domain-containing OB-fold protein [Candidatus Desulfacyla euxinica]MBL7218089.1 Zn-ribbon domain-containing OB-fold protein [Desulfobacteraceae bacterium]
MNDNGERMVLAGKVDLPFSYSAGRTASRFFVELRDHQKIMGKRCPRCLRIIVPAQLFCKECFVETDEWVEVGPEGTLLTFTVVYRKENHHPREAPLAYGIIRLDGADTSIVHLLEETDVTKLEHGMSVRALFSEKREGHIMDIECFCPV